MKDRYHKKANVLGVANKENGVDFYFDLDAKIKS